MSQEWVIALTLLLAWVDLMLLILLGLQVERLWNRVAAHGDRSHHDLGAHEISTCAVCARWEDDQ